MKYMENVHEKKAQDSSLFYGSFFHYFKNNIKCAIKASRQIKLLRLKGIELSRNSV